MSEVNQNLAELVESLSTRLTNVEERLTSTAGDAAAVIRPTGKAIPRKVIQKTVLSVEDYVKVSTCTCS